MLTNLPYGSESWVTYRCHIHLLEGFHQHCLCRRFLLGIHWNDYITMWRSLRRLGSLASWRLSSWRCSYAGQDTSLGCLNTAYQRSRYLENYHLAAATGAPRKRYKDTLKKALSVCRVGAWHSTTKAADRGAWCHTVHQATSTSTAVPAWRKEFEVENCVQAVPTQPRPDIPLQPPWKDLPVSNWPSVCLSSAISVPVLEKDRNDLTSINLLFWREHHQQQSAAMRLETQCKQITIRHLVLRKHSIYCFICSMLSNYTVFVLRVTVEYFRKL